MTHATTKPEVQQLDIPTVAEVKAIWGVDPRKSPLTYRFSFYDPDLDRLRSYLQRLFQAGFVFEDIEPASPAFGRIYGPSCWVLRVLITGVFPSATLKKICEDCCEDVRAGMVWAIFTTIGCQHPSHNSGAVDWKRDWNEAVSRGKKEVELKKVARSALALRRLDTALRKLKPAKASKFTNWMLLTRMRVKGLGLVLIDMRPGPSEDELLIALPRGEYELSLRAHVGVKRIAGMRVIKPTTVGRRSHRLGVFSTDMATLGVYDRQSMSRLLHKGRQAFSEWGETARVDEWRLYDVLVYDLEAGAILPCVQTGLGDGRFPIYELAKKGKRVGFEVEFINELGTAPAIAD